VSSLSSRRFVGLALILAIGALLHPWTVIPIANPTLRMGEGPGTPIAFPYSAPIPAGQVTEFVFTIHAGRLTQRSIVFVPDDHFVSLSVNGRDVPLDGVDPKQRDDYRRGFRFPIGAYLRPGDNAVVARVLNRNGVGGLDVDSDPHDWRNVAEGVSAVGAFLLLLGVALRRLEVTWAITAPLLAGVALRFGYLSVTPSWLRDHDVAGHLEYIEYILNHHSLPPPYGGWSFYHPPLYYVLSAGLWKVMTLVGVRSRDAILCALQVQSMLYQLGFLAFSLRTASLWIGRLPDAAFGARLSSRTGIVALMATLLCVWPSGIIHSVRIGNDDPFYLLFAAGLYFASRWWVDGRDRDLHVAAGFGAIGMFTKSNSLLLFIVLGVLLVARFALDRQRRVVPYLRLAWPGAAMFVVSAGAALGRAVADMSSGKRQNLLMGNVHSLQANLVVGDQAQNFLWFDAKAFVTHAFMSPVDDAMGRQFFWNYALKTSLFGEFSFDHPRLWDLAVVISVLLLFIVALAVLGVALGSRNDWLDDLPALVTTATLVGGLAAIRMALPLSAVGDFRYIVPVLTPAIYLFARSLVSFRQRGWTWVAWTGSLAGWSFAACSALFFVIVTATQ